MSTAGDMARRTRALRTRRCGRRGGTAVAGGPELQPVPNFEQRGDDFAAASARKSVDLRAVTNQTATYLANPDDVHRVLLLYSGGLDTSVMLKWIQDQYDAEVVALTVNLGQPGEDYDVVKGKAPPARRGRCARDRRA